VPPKVKPLVSRFANQPFQAASYRKINTVPTSNPLNDRCQSDSVIPLNIAIDFSAIEAALNEHATEIRKCAKRAAGDICEIGRRLTQAKKLLGHGNWLPWLEREFGWSDRTALNYMRVFEMWHTIGKSETVSDLNIDVTALYLLARPSTSVETQRQIIDLAATTDTPVTGAVVKEAMRTGTPPQPEVKPKKRRRTDELSKFKDAIKDITGWTVCLDIEVPPLSEADAADAIKEIEEAENELRALKARIKAAVAQTLTPSDGLDIPPFLKRTKADHDA
jgi:hypothetical protein